MAGGADNARFVDVEEVVQKLSFDRALSHDELVKLLGTWAQGDSAPTSAASAPSTPPGQSPTTSLRSYVSIHDHCPHKVRPHVYHDSRQEVVWMLRGAVCCAEDFRILGTNVFLKILEKHNKT